MPDIIYSIKIVSGGWVVGGVVVVVLGGQFSQPASAF